MLGDHVVTHRAVGGEVVELVELAVLQRKVDQRPAALAHQPRACAFHHARIFGFDGEGAGGFVAYFEQFGDVGVGDAVGR